MKLGHNSEDLGAPLSRHELDNVELRKRITELEKERDDFRKKYREANEDLLIRHQKIKELKREVADEKLLKKAAINAGLEQAKELGESREKVERLELRIDGLNKQCEQIREEETYMREKWNETEKRKFHFKAKAERLEAALREIAYYRGWVTVGGGLATVQKMAKQAIKRCGPDCHHTEKYGFVHEADCPNS